MPSSIFTWCLLVDFRPSPEKVRLSGPCLPRPARHTAASMDAIRGDSRCPTKLRRTTLTNQPRSMAHLRLFLRLNRSSYLLLGPVPLLTLPNTTPHHSNPPSPPPTHAP